MDSVILQLQNVGKYYYSETSVTQALRKINLEFQRGEFVAITGESGSGKSTLLNIISGLDTFDEGEMYFRGSPTFPFDEQDWENYRRDEIGFVFQDYSLIGHYTALDNVAAAIMIRGQKPQQARQRALEYLEQVGLGEYAGQRTSQLSSGQKQRLAIARALAKDTDIIVADEPTGNLDSETGIQVMEILEKLSKNKLIIMVTHNYEQAEPYVTRKIRLHDGEIVADTSVRERGHSTDRDINTRQDRKEFSEVSGINRMAAFFALKNIGMQRGRALLFFCFFLVTAVISFLFIGELLIFADDRITREYDSSAFLQQNDARLVVRYTDNRELTAEDREKILSVKHVREADLYGYADDVRYYYQEGRDYKYSYKTRKKKVVTKFKGEESYEETLSEEVKDIKLLEKEQFVKSAYCLTEEDLSEGHLPQARNEIVLYSEDKSVLNREQECYFTADNVWEAEETYHTRVKVVGLLKRETDQIYFDHRLCQMLTVGIDRGYSLDYCWDKKFKTYRGKMKIYPVIGEGLNGKEIRISSNYDVPGTGYQNLPTNPKSAFTGIETDKDEDGKALLHVGNIEDTGEFTEESDILAGIDEPAHLIGLDGILVDVKGIEVKVQLEEFTDQGADIVEMSEELFYQLYTPKTTQASVYIDDYAKTDVVIDEMIRLGYDAVSTYQVSSTNYIEDKVYQRLEVIGISSLVLIVMMALQLLLIPSILKIKAKDYDVLKFMGMRMRQMERITYLEMGIHAILAMAFAAMIMGGLYAGRSVFVVHMLQYYTPPAVLLFILYNMLLMVFAVFFFHRRLKRKTGRRM